MCYNYTKMLFDRLVNEYILDEAYRWSPATIAYYRARLAPFVEFCSTNNISPETITARNLKHFFAEINETYSSWHTRNGTYTVVKSFMCWLYAEHYIDKDVFARAMIKRPRKPKLVKRTVTMKHVTAMMQAAINEGTVISTRNIAIMVLLLTTGLRRKELASLQLGQIDLDTGWIFVTGKGGNQRVVPLNADAVTSLQHWLAVRPETKDKAVFTTLRADNRGGAYHEMKPDNINDILIKYRDLAGISSAISVSPHKWRHAYATFLARGGDPFALQQLMGHSHISTTAIYVDNDPNAQKRLVNKFLPKLNIF